MNKHINRMKNWKTQEARLMVHAYVNNVRLRANRRNPKYKNTLSRTNTSEHYFQNPISPIQLPHLLVLEIHIFIIYIKCSLKIHI